MDFWAILVKLKPDFIILIDSLDQNTPKTKFLLTYCLFYAGFWKISKIAKTPFLAIFEALEQKNGNRNCFQNFARCSLYYDKTHSKNLETLPSAFLSYFKSLLALFLIKARKRLIIRASYNEQFCWKFSLDYSHLFVSSIGEAVHRILTKM